MTADAAALREATFTGARTEAPAPVRAWNNTGCRVSTLHPTYGELWRGTIRPRPTRGAATGAWEISDQDHTHVATITGDYLDAETALLAATTWADEPAPEGDQP